MVHNVGYWCCSSASEPIACLNVCSFMGPTLMIITGVVLFRIDFSRYPLSDGLPMALLG